MPLQVLIVDRNPGHFAPLKELCAQAGIDVAFVIEKTGRGGLQKVLRDKIDILICSENIEDVGAVDFMSKLREFSPQTVRLLAISKGNHSVNQENLKVVHQTFPRDLPDMSYIVQTFKRIEMMSEVVDATQLRRAIGAQISLPTLPDVYMKVSSHLNTPQACAESVARIIEEDLAISAYILKVSNSAFYGLKQTIKTLDNAISMLGLVTTKNIVLIEGMLKPLALNPDLANTLRRLSINSLGIGKLCRLYAKASPELRADPDDAQTIGELAHIGSIFLAVFRPELFVLAMKKADQDKRDFLELERELFKVDHSKVGAFLLAIWGFPFHIVEAIAHHHNPPSELVGDNPYLSILHAAQFLAREQKAPKAIEEGGAHPLRQTHFNEARLTVCFEQWRELTQKTAL